MGLIAGTANGEAASRAMCGRLAKVALAGLVWAVRHASNYSQQSSNESVPACTECAA